MQAREFRVSQSDGAHRGGTTGDQVYDPQGAGRPPATAASDIAQPAVAWSAGFHTTVLPISAGAVGRLPAIAVKLNGVIAVTKPSNGLWSVRFHSPGAEPGCSARIFRAYCTLNRQKSMSSQAESISACCTDLDWPRMVAAFSVSRHGPASRSAAAQEDRGAFVEGEITPRRRRRLGGADRRGHIRLGRLRGLAKHVSAVVGLDDAGTARRPPFAARRRW